MANFAKPLRSAVGIVNLLLFLLAPVSSVRAQSSVDGFVTGEAARAWDHWQAAMRAIIDRNAGAAEAEFARLMEADVSPLRLALMADRTLRETNQGAGLVLLEQDATSGALSDNGKAVYERLQQGEEHLNQADDGFYFSSLGQFAVANANFEALLASKPDPVALLEFVDRVEKREEILVLVSNNPIVGRSAREVLRLLAAGEYAIKSDPTRIIQNIERLAGPPRQFENSVARLKDSGEFSIPFLIQALRDPARPELLQPVLRTIPLVGRAALNPLVISLRMNDDAAKVHLVQSLGRIGYAQAVPYLLKLRESPDTTPVVHAAVDGALAALAERGVSLPAGLSAAEAFLQLADDYYADVPSLRADPRLDVANVWYWRDNLLQNIAVPREIFNEIMCMRACEEALLLAPNLQPALALWIGANLRREAQLPPGAVDPTRPDNYPSAAYFAQTAGPYYATQALSRALRDGETAVALGAIAALRNTGGPASVLADADGRQPLADALSFGDRMVRIRAALALANAAPTERFRNYQNLMPVLSEALLLHGGVRNALVVDPDSGSANNAAALLRSDGFNVVTNGSLFNGLDKARQEMPGLDLIVVASDISGPTLAEGMAQVRADFRLAALPVIVLAKPGTLDRATQLSRDDARVGVLPPAAAPEHWRAEIERVSRAAGVTALTPELGLAVSLETAAVLHKLAQSGDPLWRIDSILPALLTALRTDDLSLKLSVAGLAGYVCDASAQSALCDLALSDAQPAEVRVPMFAALAEAAKRCGNLLDHDRIERLLGAAQNESDLTIRTAASQAVGALNLPGNPASVVIRNQHAG
ncbi:MAG: hypothetical protein LC135_06880 [Phycisphaerae bacterium]|nr:hypothetical protein [Phycisphaerae bacterium]MCZ2399580.1 hypothetical protein [Phycisphaerae bacterium]